MKELKFKTYNSFSNFKEDAEAGILYIEGYASKMYDSNNKPVIDYDNEFVDLTKFDLSVCKTLLFNHDNEEYAVGKCSLEKRADGAYLYGEIHKEMNDKVYYAVKYGIMTDFSIGFVASNAEYRTIDGKDILTFTEGFVYETSICNVIGANPLAKIQASKKLKDNKKALEVAEWLDNIKSIKIETPTDIKLVKDGKGCIGFQCDISSLKKANPNGDCSCLVDLKKEKIEMENMEKNIKQSQTFDKEQFAEAVSKGLTIQETMNEPWNISDDFWKMLSYFIQTVEDNYDSFRWEDLSKEEMLVNLASAFDIFKNTVTEVADKINAVNAQEAVDNMGLTVKSLEGDKIEMKTKNVENVEVENTETVEGTEQTETTEETTVVAEEQSEKTETKEVVKENLKSEEETSEDTSVGEAIKADETTIKDDSAVEAEPLDVNKEVIAILSADLDKLEAEDIQSLYDTLADKLGDLYSAHEALNKIEAYVKENV